MLTVSFVHIGTTGNCKEVKEKLLGFVMYIYKLASTVVHGSDSCVKRVDRFCTKYRLASLKFRDPLEENLKKIWDQKKKLPRTAHSSAVLNILGKVHLI